MKYEYWLDNTGLSAKKKVELLKKFQSAAEIYRLKERDYSGTAGWKEADTLKIEKVKKHWDVDREYERLQSMGFQFTCFSRQNYPEKLRNISEPPFGLYYKGELPKEEFSVAVVGARRCSEYGHFMAGKLAQALGKNRIPVIGGLAEGIDSAGHTGALQAGGKTFAVLGCGVDICYPEKNRELYQKISENGGILSELLPGTEPRPYHFPARNRIISGLADVVIVIEAKKKSGSLITADYALEQGKEVYALPGRVTDALSYGCNRLIGQGAGCILSVEEFLAQLPIPGILKKKEEKKKKLCLAKEESLVYSCLSVETKSIEKIAEETSLDISTVAAVLMKLAAKGLVRESFQNYYIED